MSELNIPTITNLFDEVKTKKITSSIELLATFFIDGQIAFEVMEGVPRGSTLVDYTVDRYSNTITFEFQVPWYSCESQPTMRAI